MLSIAPQDFPPQTSYSHHRQISSRNVELPLLHLASMGSPFATTTASAATNNIPGPRLKSPPQDSAVVQALEIARESPDGASDPTISRILEGALSQIWQKVQAAPASYVMSRDEFAVFNFFQYRFTGDKIAMSARKRYWDNTRA